MNPLQWLCSQELGSGMEGSRGPRCPRGWGTLCPGSDQGGWLGLCCVTSFLVSALSLASVWLSHPSPSPPPGCGPAVCPLPLQGHLQANWRVSATRSDWISLETAIFSLRGEIHGDTHTMTHSDTDTVTHTVTHRHTCKHPQHTETCTYTLTHTQITHRHPQTYTCTHRHTHSDTLTCMNHAQTHAQTQTYKDTHAQTHTLSTVGRCTANNQLSDL